MGLDFSLYKKKKNLTSNEFFNRKFDEYEEDELAYGRKSWELVYKLATHEDIENGEGILTSERWEGLMNDISYIADKLDAINEAYDHEDYALNHPDRYPEAIFTKEDKKLIALYEHWYDKTFDVGGPYLGYDWSVGYMTVFWEAKDRVKEVLDDPEYEVMMYISY